jgi:hypothetical protein
MKKKKVSKPSKAVVQKQFEKLEKLAAKRGGILPAYSWLNKHGYFYAYDIVRKAGLLNKFERDGVNPGPAKKAKPRKKSAQKTRRPHSLGTNPILVTEVTPPSA